MSDLIERQAAIDAIEDHIKAYTSEMDGYNMARRHMKELIEVLPSAQPEIIRCKNCEWWSNDEYRECSSPNYDTVHVTPAGFYCGWAERRIDG